LDRALSQRSQLEDTWENHLQLYRAPTDRGIAHFPFEGANNVTVPVAAMNVDPILARWMQNIHAAENLWTLKPLNERWINAAKPLQDYLTWLDKMLLKMWDVNYRVFMETLKLGTGIYKTDWQYVTRRKVGYDANKQRTRFTETINRPFVDQVHLANFLLPPESRSIDPDAQGGAVWVGERHRFRPEVLRTMSTGQQPFLPNFDPAAVAEIIKFEESRQTDRDQKVNELDQLGQTLPTISTRPIELWELHARFDTTGNGLEDDVVVIFHAPSLTIVRATYPTLPFRPYSAIRYLRGDGFYGIGICEQADVWQNTISRVLNFDLDKILLSNAPMLAVKEGANVVPDEPIFPGKQWHLQDPKNDLTPFFLTAPGSFDIATVRAYLTDQVKQRTGLTDLQFGAVGSLPSRTPATTVQSLLQEGNTRLDLSIKDLRESGLSEVGLRVLQNLQLQATDSVSNPDAQEYVNLALDTLGQAAGQEVARVLSVPSEAIELGVGVALTATSGTSNKELMRQSNLSLIQITSQLAPGFIQLAQIAQQGGPVGEVAKTLFEGGAELLRRLMEQFDVRNPDEIVPTLQSNLNALQALQQGQQIAPVAGGNGGGVAQGVGGLAGP
jgi:hypothetical protein